MYSVFWFVQKAVAEADDGHRAMTSTPVPGAKVGLFKRPTSNKRGRTPSVRKRKADDTSNSGILYSEYCIYSNYFCL